MILRDFITALLDFPLSSEVCIEQGYEDDLLPIIGVSYDKEIDEGGYTVYSITTIHCTDNIISSEDNLWDNDFRGEFVNIYDEFEVYNEESKEFFKVKYDTTENRFKKIT